MPTEDVVYQQRMKIRRTTLGFGVIQVLLGLALTGLSFTAFVLSESEKIRNACPYWAGFTVFCSGGVGIVAWRYTTVLSMGLFTFFSAVCVVLHMIGTILTGEIGGLLKSIIMCQHSVMDNYVCECCDSIMTCKQNVPTFEFEGVEQCGIITGLMKELMYGLCVLNIFGSLVCFIATILGCTSVARQAGRDQPLFRRRLSARSDSHEQSQYSWLHYPTDLNVLPPYAPPIYRSVDNVQDCGATPYIVPPPVFDPTDLPPPYSSRNASLSSSGFSLNVPDVNSQRGPPNDRQDNTEGSSAIVLSEGGAIIHHRYENHFQQRVYSENRARPGNAVQITNVVLTPNGILERCGTENRPQRPAVQSITSLNSSRASLQSEARISLDRMERQILHNCEKAEECKETRNDITSQERIYKYKQSSRMRRLSNVEQSSELIMFEESRNKRNSKELKRQSSASKSLDRKLKSPKVTEDEFSSTSDSGIGEELALLSEPTDSVIESDTETIRGNDEEDDVLGNDNADISERGCEGVVISIQDVISLDDHSVKKHCTDRDTLTDVDKLAQNGDFQLQMNENNFLEPFDTEKSEDWEKSLIDCKFPSDLQVESQKINGSLCLLEAQEHSTRQALNFDYKSYVPQVRSHSNDISENAANEEGSDSTEEVIRLMDDFFTTKSIIRTRNEESECGVSESHDTRSDVKHTDVTRGSEDENCRGLLAKIPEISATDSLSISINSLRNSVRPLPDINESLPIKSETTLERKKSCLAARSDTCMALPRTSLPRELGAVSDPGVSGIGAFKYPASHRPFRNGSTIIPPNIELPKEIQEECLGHAFSVTDSKRRKRQNRRDVPRPKRRALENDEFSRMKARSHHKSSRKEETTRLRERHLKSQNARVRDELSRNYRQTYSGKSSVPKTNDEWLRNPSSWSSFKKGKSVQRLRGSSAGTSSTGLHENTKPLSPDVKTGNDGCTGKETFV